MTPISSQRTPEDTSNFHQSQEWQENCKKNDYYRHPSFGLTASLRGRFCAVTGTVSSRPWGRGDKDAKKPNWTGSRHRRASVARDRRGRRARGLSDQCRARPGLRGHPRPGAARLQQPWHDLGRPFDRGPNQYRSAATLLRR